MHALAGDGNAQLVILAVPILGGRQVLNAVIGAGFGFDLGHCTSQIDGRVSMAARNAGQNIERIPVEDSALRFMPGSAV